MRLRELAAERPGSRRPTRKRPKVTGTTIHGANDNDTLPAWLREGAGMHDYDEENDGKFPGESPVEGPLPPASRKNKLTVCFASLF